MNSEDKASERVHRTKCISFLTLPYNFKQYLHTNRLRSVPKEYLMYSIACTTVFKTVDTAIKLFLISIKSWRAYKVPIPREVAARVRATSDVDVIECEVTAVTITAQDVVILCITLRCTSDVLHRDVRDDDTAGRKAGWTAIEIVLLDVDAVDGYV